MSRQYYGIEDLGMTQAQRQTLLDALQKIQPRIFKNPAHNNHMRVRPDGLAAVFEGEFKDDDWTVQTLTNRLAAIFDIDPGIISTDTQQTPYGPAVTFGAGGTDRLRFAAFGGLLASWEESHAAVLAFLAANAADWEPQE